MAESLPLNAALLPTPRTRLIGREAERARARSLLLDDAVPLLTLVGTGGVGKTRLALAIASETADRFADGVVWVDLTPLVDPSLVPSTLAAALDLPPASGRSAREQIARALRSRQTLLALDNCEHVLDEAAALVGFLLPRCPALQVLATSRAPLRLHGEHALLIDPLPVPADASSWDVLARNDAVRLFVDRARAVDSGFHIHERNAPTVAAVCRRLDGLPLAIELAAARITILSPDALLARMTDRLRLLRGGARDSPTRHQTMHAAIAWSYALLAPEAQKLFRRLAVFAGGCALEAARSVAAPEDDGDGVEEALPVLVEQSLLLRMERDGEPRFTMLETIREFARDQLAASAENEPAHAAHARFFLAMAEQAYPFLISTGDPGWLDRLETEHDNLLAALGWLAETGDVAGAVRLAGALSWFWYYHGHLQEGRAWLERALAMDADDPASRAPASARADVLVGLGVLAHTLGEGERAVALLGQGAAVRRAEGDGLSHAYAEGLRGGALVSLGRYDEAEPLFTELLGWYQTHYGGHVMAGHALFHLGLVAYSRGDRERTRLLCQQAVAHFDVTDSRLDAIDPLHYLGLNACAEGDVASAQAFFAEALTRLRQRRSRVDFANGLADVATLAATRGHAEQAARLFGAADAIRREDGAPFPLPARLAYEEAAAATQSALGEERWTVAYSVGATLPLDHALAEAEGELLTDARARSTPAPLAAAPPAHHGIERFLLTRREQEVLALLCQRLTDAEIAEQLFLSPRTASTHVGNILGKLRAENRREAAAIAARQGLISLA